MEVHHHPDLEHKKKKFREYFLEFLMIFLAVTMGFIAENLREGITDRKKEKEYIESLVQDLKTDTARAARIVRGLTAQVHGMDTLEVLLRPGINKNDSLVQIAYRQQQSLHNQHTMSFSSRTITQLFSSGNMRLIRDRSVSDGITGYYDSVREVDMQKQYYIDYFHKCLEIYQQLYYFDSYHTHIDTAENIELYSTDIRKIRIGITNSDSLNRFKATIEITKQIIFSYRRDVELLDQKAGDLLVFLKREYDLKDE